ncbi:MAG TPA: aminotransferase class I/II-fold pyridoxal phosphate-dependent enzyme [Bacillota bacterium]|nr:aminotransferase class I/II-fold pyridoxal phosphate-dependent enzyme [Bacillota bacterium]
MNNTAAAIRQDERTLADFFALPDPDIFAKTRPFFQFCEGVRERGHYLYRRTLMGPSANRVTIWDEERGSPRSMVMMASNNYLGLTTHPRVVEAGLDAQRRYGAGSGSVSLLAGTLDLHRQLEERLAAFKSCEDAVIFPAGYSANVGCVMGLAREGDLVINDILNHASIIDGCRLSGAAIKTFPHCSVEALDKLLARQAGSHAGRLVIVDGVFSMDGDIAPLPRLIEVCRKHGARLMVDEAHATGVIGPGGRGTPAHHGVEGQVDLVAGTLSKALGGVGGFVAATREVVHYLRFYARSYMFSTALPPAVAGSVLAALDVLDDEPELLRQLWDNIRYLQAGLRGLGFNLGNQETAIFPLIIGDDVRVKEMGRLLHEAGIYANPVFYPAVSRRLSRIRLSLMATHTREDLDLTLSACEEAGRKLGII